MAPLREQEEEGEQEEKQEQEQEQVVAWGDRGLEAFPMVLPPMAQNLKGVEDLWAVFGPMGLTEHMDDVYNTGEASDAVYQAFMRWIYWHGWNVVMECRDAVEAYPAHFLCRTWKPAVEVEAEVEVSAEQAAILEADREAMLRERARSERRFKAPAAAERGGWSSSAVAKVLPLSAPGTDVGRRNGCPVLQFCKEGTACPTAGCKFVHGNTIPVKETCCGGPREGPHAGDPAHCTKRIAAPGRTPCIFLHPDQTWTAELVVTRPTA